MTWKGTPIARGWLYQESETGAQIILDHLDGSGSRLYAWVEMRAPGRTLPVAFGRQDIMGPRAGVSFLKDARERAPNIPWAEGMDTAFYETVHAFQEDATTIDLVAWETRPTQWILKPLLEAGGHTRIIAPGDSGKSYFALACGLTIATGSAKFVGIKPDITGPVLYLDWETNADTHARRLRALCKGVDAPLPDRDTVIYQEQTQPLYRTAHQIHKTIATYGIKVVVVDSTMLARGAGGDRAEDSAIRLFEALRAFPVSAALIDHKPKEAIAKGRRGGYGSVVNDNSVRLQWEMTRITPVGQYRKAFSLSLEKHNNTGRMPPISYQFTVTPAELNGSMKAMFERVDTDKLAAVEDKDLGDRIVYLLSGSDEPLTVKKIAEALAAKETSIRSRLNADGRFENRAAGGQGRWMVADEYRDEGMQDELDLTADDEEEDVGEDDGMGEVIF